VIICNTCAFVVGRVGVVGVLVCVIVVVVGGGCDVVVVS